MDPARAFRTRRATVTGLLLIPVFCVIPDLRAQTVSGNEIIERSGCAACHRLDEKLVGPSFRSIAAKYRSRTGAVEQLADVVRNGTDEPEWGDLPMPANPPEKISDTDLKQVLDFILTL